MEPFLENGSMAGKILCPNQKCKAKIGNYDWAGVQCGCKDWVVPVSTGRVLSIPGPPIAHPSFVGVLHRPKQGRRGLVIWVSKNTMELE